MFKLSPGSDITGLPSLAGGIEHASGATLSQSVITELAGLGDQKWISTRFTRPLGKQLLLSPNCQLPAVLEEQSLEL